MTGEAVTELFPLDEMVYLSPDAEEELSSLSEEDVYVLGGLVDESIAKVNNLLSAILMLPYICI